MSESKRKRIYFMELKMPRFFLDDYCPNDNYVEIRRIMGRFPINNHTYRPTQSSLYRVIALLQKEGD